MHNTVELIGGDDLGVQVDHSCLPTILGLSVCKHSPGLGLASTWWSHDEDGMSNLHKLTKLNDLFDEVLMRIQCGSLGLLGDNSFKSHVSLSWWVESWEQVTEEIVEDLQVSSCDFR